MQKKLIIVFIALFLGLTGWAEFPDTKDFKSTEYSFGATAANMKQNDGETNPTNNELPSDLPTVSRIVDGDTIVVLINGIPEKIRLIGIDTPETVDPRKKVECFGKEASAFTKNLLQNKTVRLESDESQGDRDKYGRLLRYVFLADGTFANKEIIALGYGHEYTYRTPYKYQTDFRDAERAARGDKMGLWAPDACGVENII